MRINGTDYLPVCDFDGTIADTLSPSPNGLDVHVAYARSLSEVFGTRDLLKNIGGVQNRTPAELVAAVIAHRQGAMTEARRYYTEHRAELSKLAPNGAMLPVLRADNETMAVAETVVRLKLKHLLREIGPEWPKPCAGVLDYLRALRAAGKPVAIISSGHEGFIRRWFAEYDLAPPDIVLSDDDLRWTALPPEKKAKPSRVVFDWFLIKSRKLGFPLKEEMSYAGDSWEKDGKFAHNIGIPFGWFNPNGAEPGGQLYPDDRSFADWREVL